MGAIAAKLFKTQSSGNGDWEKHRAFLRNFVDPDHGLLDELLRREALDREEIAIVRAERTYFERNAKLMEYIFNKRKEETFLLTLKDSDQKHIANYIRRDGVYVESCGDCWPLTENQISTLEVNELRLKELLVPEDSGLLASLYSSGVINNWQRQTISSNGTDFEKNQALLDVLRRRSKGDYNTAIHCLHNTGQDHIAQVLENGGAIARIHSRVRTGQQQHEGIDEAIIASFVRTLQDANFGQTRSIQILNGAIEAIALMRLQSIDIYVLCKTLDELEQLKAMQINGKLAKAISSFFVQLLKSAQIEKLEVNTEDLENINVETELYDEENERCMAYLSRSAMLIESSIIVLGKYYREKGAYTINLNRPDEVSALQQLPIGVSPDLAGAVYCDSLFVTGIGEDKDEIWRFDAKHSKWNKCASLIRGRFCHSVAFVDHILYICGGCRGHYEILNDVVAYDSIDDKCSAVGKLFWAVYDAGNCVPYKASLYIFGGINAQGRSVKSVQVYNTKSNYCVFLKNQMPRNENYLRAALFKNYVILLRDKSCFLYNFDTETWEVRDQFKTNVNYFGVTIHNEKLFVIGGIDSNWILRDDVRYVPIVNVLNDEPIEWNHHAKLPRPREEPFEVYAFAKLEFL